MYYCIINKDKMGQWISALAAKRNVYGPKKKENSFVFSQVNSYEEMTLLYRPTILPPKKYYFPQKESLLNFKNKPFLAQESKILKEENVLFAVHSCDIAGIQCMDAVFADSPPDPNYFRRKDTMTIVGIECLDYCDEYASCAAVGTHVYKGGYDIMLTDIGESFAMHINSDKGEKLIKGQSYIRKMNEAQKSLLKKVIEKKLSCFHNEFSGDLKEIDKAFDKGFFSPVWDDVGRRCVGCTNCNAVCPTCYCFDIEDEMNLDLNQGSRVRVWNYCQMDDFAKVATGEDFRAGRNARQRHRYFRKFKYSVLKYNKYFCTGCGRCTRTCMAKISLIETVDSLLKNERKNGQ